MIKINFESVIDTTKCKFGWQREEKKENKKTQNNNEKTREAYNLLLLINLKPNLLGQQINIQEKGKTTIWDNKLQTHLKG